MMWLLTAGSGEPGHSDGVHTGVCCSRPAAGDSGEREGGEGEGETEARRGEETRGGGDT